MNENPYSTSYVEEPRQPLPEETATEVFRAWERRRFLFSTILGTVALVISRRHLADPGYWNQLLQYFVVINLAFCAGPVCEGYAAYFGLDRRKSRVMILVLGTIIGVAATYQYIGVLSTLWNP